MPSKQSARSSRAFGVPSTLLVAIVGTVASTSCKYDDCRPATVQLADGTFESNGSACPDGPNTTDFFDSNGALLYSEPSNVGECGNIVRTLPDGGTMTITEPC